MIFSQCLWSLSSFFPISLPEMPVCQILDPLNWSTVFLSFLFVHLLNSYKISLIISPILLLLFSRSIMSNSLQPHGLQHTKPPCPSPSPGACSNSCPSSWWCHPTISSSVIPFSYLQSSLASRSILISQFLTSGGQSIGASASASVLPMNTQDWFDFL